MRKAMLQLWSNILSYNEVHPYPCLILTLRGGGAQEKMKANDLITAVIPDLVIKKSCFFFYAPRTASFLRHFPPLEG